MYLHDFKRMNEVVSKLARLNSDVRDYARAHQRNTPYDLNHIINIVRENLNLMKKEGLIEEVPDFSIQNDSNKPVVEMEDEVMLQILGLKK